MVMLVQQLNRAAQPDMHTALFLAALCGQTYNQFNNSSGLFLVPRSYRMVGEITASSYESSLERFGFLLVSEQAAVLAFRGSGSAEDWVSDFIAQQTPYRLVRDAGLTHKGFTDIYMSARSGLLKLLTEVPSDVPLFITGHSLGGALATLAALDLVHNTASTSPVVYTFGAPRVGDPRFVRKYNTVIKHHWRFQNEYDIVPHLPTLIYQSPQTSRTYYYMHVKGEVKRSFRAGSVSGNHILSSYFTDLAKEAPALADTICKEPPGLCPSYETNT